MTSGATGRNGGHLVSSAASDFVDLVNAFGHEQAVQAARFSFACIDRVREIAAVTLDDEAREASEIREVIGVMGFRDLDSWTRFKTSLAMFEDALPEFRGRYTLLETAKELEVRTVSLRWLQTVMTRVLNFH